MKLLHIAINSNYFTWNGQIYKQTEGCPMGSPISPIIANLFMQKLETSIIPRYEQILFYRRYFDDFLSIVKQGTEETILTSLNDFHPSIQFTMEKECNKQLPFLDIHLTCSSNGTITKKVYRKPTHTGRYLNYKSYHHISQKMSVVDALTYRAIKICDVEFLEDELDHIRGQLRQNEFPIRFINSRIEVMKARVNQRKQEEQEVPRLILPYMGPLTSRLTQYLRKRIGLN